MEERADLSRSGIPLGFARTGSCGHRQHGYILWLRDGPRSVKQVLEEISVLSISPFGSNELGMFILGCVHAQEESSNERQHLT